MKYTNHFLATKLRSSAVVLFANIYRFQTDHLIHIFEIEIGTKSEIYFRIINNKNNWKTNEWNKKHMYLHSDVNLCTERRRWAHIRDSCNHWSFDCCNLLLLLLLFHYHWSMYCSLLCCYWLKMLIDFIFQIQRDITNLLLLLLFASNSATNRQAMPMNVTKSTKTKTNFNYFNTKK